MKLLRSRSNQSILLALGLLSDATLSAAAFTYPTTRTTAPVGSTAGVAAPAPALEMSRFPPGEEPSARSTTPPEPPEGRPGKVEEEGEPMFPVSLPLETVQGGNTVRTYKMPPGTERAQYMLKSPGTRPLKAKVELLLGPIRTVHTLEIDNMNSGGTDDQQDGSPIRATIQFKKGGDPMIRVTTSDFAEFPVQVGVYVPSARRSAQLASITDAVFADPTNDKVLLQGGTTSGGRGSVRTFAVNAADDAVQLVCWSRDVGKKSFKARIELLHGPNALRQTYDIQCGGSTQPWHGIFQVPGPGWVIRIRDKKFVEDGHFEAALMPYDDLGAEKRGGDGDGAEDWTVWTAPKDQWHR